MSRKELVSILIPAYNAEKWIGETLRSAAGQSWNRKEIIVVDDGSTDKTLSIARRHESPILKVVHQENQGGCSARNRAYAECQGDFIQWLDADDLLAPDKIERQLKMSQDKRMPDVLFSCAWGEFFYRPRKAKFYPTPLWKSLSSVEWLMLRLEEGWMMPPNVWLVSRRLAEDAGGWDERLKRNQDGEYFLRVVLASSFVKFVSESRAYYRRWMSSPSVSRSRSRDVLCSLCLSYELEVQHVLAKDDSGRAREACIRRLSRGVAALDYFDAPDLAGCLRERIGELGGEVVAAHDSRNYAALKKVMGGRAAKEMKRKVWRARAGIARKADYVMGMVFGTEL
jgi:glycosyltransferase involved in cell wall biosynthesis